MLDSDSDLTKEQADDLRRGIAWIDAYLRIYGERITR